IFFEADGISGQHKAVINPLVLPGLGVYTVRVRAEVSEGASWQQGEGFNPDVPQLPRHTVPEFVRETTAQFGLNTTRITPIPDDCDENGIPNELEPPGDLDGDGI